MDVIEALEVGPAWAGHPVGFALLTSGERQYVAFYDEDRALRVASRELSSRSWHVTRLPVTTTWDSHRYITMAMDRGGHLHLAGNMHNSPLVYFRLSRPHDAESFHEFNAMVGRDEERCTYPRFIRGPEDALVFTYRHGSPENGAQMFNVYDEARHSWSRLIEGPLIDGEGQRGVYIDRFRPPFRGPDGFFHFCWVWRDSSDASANHSPYVHAQPRTRDVGNQFRGGTRSAGHVGDSRRGRSGTDPRRDHQWRCLRERG